MSIPSGFLLIDKRPGPTSAGVLRDLEHRLAQIFETPRKHLPKIGHTGTLDPFADGLLVVALGEGTKLVRYFQSCDKTYQTRLRFGVRTQSGDLSDPVLEEQTPPSLALESLESALQTFVTGSYEQTPPLVSAKKIDGKRSLDWLREGVEKPKAPELKKIHGFRSIALDGPIYQFSVSVQGGTYIRVLGEDLAQRLGTIGALETLRRTQVDRFDVSNAIPMDQLTRDTFSTAAFVPLSQIFSAQESIEITPEIEEHVYAGRQRPLQSVAQHSTREWVALRREGRLIAILGREPDGSWKIDRAMVQDVSCSG